MKILGIGNAIVDVLCKVSDEFLTQHSLTKSTMKLINEVEFKKILTSLKIEETISGGSVNIGPCRITYIQAIGVASSVVVLRDISSGSTGDKVFEADFGTEGLDIYVPGNGIRFENGIHATMTNTTSLTIGYTG